MLQAMSTWQHKTVCGELWTDGGEDAAGGVHILTVAPGESCECWVGTLELSGIVWVEPFGLVSPTAGSPELWLKGKHTKDKAMLLTTGHHSELGEVAHK